MARLVADGGQLGVADDLRLEAVGQDVVDVVADQIAGDGGDALFGFEDIAGGAVLLPDGERVRSSVRSRKRSSNFVSNPCLSLTAVSAVRPS